MCRIIAGVRGGGRYHLVEKYSSAAGSTNCPPHLPTVPFVDVASSQREHSFLPVAGNARDKRISYLPLRINYPDMEQFDMPLIPQYDVMYCAISSLY